MKDYMNSPNRETLATLQIICPNTFQSRSTAQRNINRDDRISDLGARVRRPAAADLRTRRDLRVADRISRASACAAAVRCSMIVSVALCLHRDVSLEEGRENLHPCIPTAAYAPLTPPSS